MRDALRTCRCQCPLRVIANLGAALNDVRFTPNSGHALERRSLPLYAMNGLMPAARYNAAGLRCSGIASLRSRHDDIQRKIAFTP
jgi:hypothetical protein